MVLQRSLVDIIPLLRSSVHVLAKVKVVDTDGGRLDGCRAGGGAAAPAGTTGVPWC
jgi:hypothetical protein